MTEEQIQFELDHWRNTPPGREERIYKSLLAFWGIPLAWKGLILEVGAGPLDGFLPHLDAPRKVSLDPLHDEFWRHNLLKHDPYISHVSKYLEDWETEDRFDLVICANTLDHGDMTFEALRKIAELMQPEGELCLHVHLRRPDQLNVGHDHFMPVSDFYRIVNEVGLVEESATIFKEDPWYKKYAALVGVWRKKADGEAD